jgi:hypothetical protein
MAIQGFFRRAAEVIAGSIFPTLSGNSSGQSSEMPETQGAKSSEQSLTVEELRADLVRLTVEGVRLDETLEENKHWDPIKILKMDQKILDPNNLKQVSESEVALFAAAVQSAMNECQMMGNVDFEKVEIDYRGHRLLHNKWYTRIKAKFSFADQEYEFPIVDKNKIFGAGIREFIIRTPAIDKAYGRAYGSVKPYTEAKRDRAACGAKIGRIREFLNVLSDLSEMSGESSDVLLEEYGVRSWHLKGIKNGLPCDIKKDLSWTEFLTDQHKCSMMVGQNAQADVITDADGDNAPRTLSRSFQSIGQKNDDKTIATIAGTLYDYMATMAEADADNKALMETSVLTLLKDFMGVSAVPDLPEKVLKVIKRVDTTGKIASEFKRIVKPLLPPENSEPQDGNKPPSFGVP